MSSLSTKILGTVAMEPKGEYSAEAYYEKLNTVLYNDSTYMAIKPSHNILPTDTEYWQLIGGGTKKEETVQVFDTVADMKLADLKDGMSVQTLGYYEINDGGSATYKITNEENETEYQEELENGLYATLIIIGIADIRQYGVSPSILDNTTKLNNAFHFNSNLYGFEGVINVSGSLAIEHSELNYDFKGLTINCNGNNIESLISIETDSSLERVRGSFKRLIIKCNGLCETGLAVYDARRLVIENCRFSGATVEEIGIYETGGKLNTCNVVLKDIRCDCKQHTIQACSNCVALDLHNVQDSYITDFIAHEYSVSIKNSGVNWFNMVHCWNWYHIVDSVMFELHESCTLTNVYCDSIATMFDIKGSQAIDVIGARTYYNNNATDMANATVYPIKVDSDFISNGGKLKITGAWFRPPQGTYQYFIKTPDNSIIKSTNRVSLVNVRVAPNFFIYPTWVDYYYKSLASSEIDYTTANNLRGDVWFYNKKFFVAKGHISYRFEVQSTDMTYSTNAGTWTDIFKVTSDTFPIDTDAIMLGYIRDSSGYIFHINWRIRSDGSVQIRKFAGDTPVTNGRIYLCSDTIQDSSNIYN